MIMKKLILILMMTVSPLMAIAQGSLSAVTLKNGTVLQGTIKSIKPTKSLKIIIAGVETTIEMSDIAKVEEVGQTVPSTPTSSTIEDNINDKLIVTDSTPYPESFDLKVGDQTIKMILVRGGILNMGYNGRHSLSYKSEPMHKVNVTSFYISSEYVKSSVVANNLKGLKLNKNPYYCTSDFKNMKEAIEAISQSTNIPVRMPTEAEWEFAACSDKQSIIFGNCNDYEFCSDWFGEFDKNDNLTDPTGPIDGKRHVFRSYSKLHSKFNRSSSEHYDYTVDKYARLVVKAKDI